MSYNGLPYGEDNESELYSAESHTEKWSGKLREDAGYLTFSDEILDQYIKNPGAFSDERDEVYCFSYVPTTTKPSKDQWMLMDTDNGRVYTVFDSIEQLNDFLKPSRARRAMRRIMMDRIVARALDKSTSFMMDVCLNTSSIQLIKDCVAATPMDDAYTFFYDEYLDEQISWKIENLTAAREAELCAELYCAGIVNQQTSKAAFPF